MPFLPGPDRGLTREEQLCGKQISPSLSVILVLVRNKTSSSCFLQSLDILNIGFRQVLVPAHSPIFMTSGLRRESEVPCDGNVC